jgi:hypothetical protein
MKKIYFFLCFSYLFINLSIGYSKEPLDSCFILVYPNDYDPITGTGTYFNPDSVMIDTCSQSSNYGKLFSKKGYEFSMKVYVFGNDILPSYTPVTWQDISSSFTQIKEGFQNLEQEFGPYTIQRTDYHPSDSLFLKNPIFEIEFQNYFKFDSVANALDEIDSTSKAWMKNVPAYIIGSKVENNNINEKSKLSVSPNPAIDEITIETNNFNGYTDNQLMIYNETGKLIKKLYFKENTIKIDVSSFSNGLYFIKVNGYTKNFIKW